MTNRFKKNIVLIGMSGAGKSTLATYLGEKFGYDVVDTDSEIKKKMGLEIEEIFDRYGEEHFRYLEREVVKEIGLKQGQVISTGGGVILFEDNIINLKKNGEIYYLETSPSVLYERLLGSDEVRPLLKGENPLESINKMYEARKGRYESYSDTIVNTDEISVESLASKLIKVHDKKILR